MAYLHYVVGCSLVMLLCVQQSYSIKCFECNSRNDSRCAQEKVPEDLQRECPSTTPKGNRYVLCRKIKQVIDFEVNGLPPDTRTIRTCGWDTSSYKDRCYQRSGFGGRQEVCACETDLCNGANSLFLLPGAVLVPALFALLKLTL